MFALDTVRARICGIDLSRAVIVLIAVKWWEIHHAAVVPAVCGGCTGSPLGSCFDLEHILSDLRSPARLCSVLRLRETLISIVALSVIAGHVRGRVTILLLAHSRGPSCGVSCGSCPRPPPKLGASSEVSLRIVHILQRGCPMARVEVPGGVWPAVGTPFSGMCLLE